MKRFVQFMTLNNERTYIDPQTIVRFSEYKYRDNDNGYVGTRIEYTGNDSTLVTFTVKDPIDAVADILVNTPKYVDIPALNERLIFNKESDPVLTENINNFRQAMQEKGAKAAQVRSDLVLLDTPSLKPYTGPSIEDFIDFLENDPVNLQIRPTPSSHRTPPQETPLCNGNGEAQSTEE